MVWYILLGTLAAYGAFSAIWASLGWLLPGLRGCAVVYMGTPGEGMRRRWRWLGFGLATGLGLAMGVCHTMDGAHFLSHTFVSLFIAWLLAACLYGLLPRLRLFLSRPHWRRHHESAHHRG